jgi:hypothetical protein
VIFAPSFVTFAPSFVTFVSSFVTFVLAKREALANDVSGASAP